MGEVTGPGHHAGIGPPLASLPQPASASPGPPSQKFGALQVAGLLYVFSTPLDIVPFPVGTPVTITGLVLLVVWGYSVGRGAARIPRGGGLLGLLAALVIWSFATVGWSYVPRVSTTQSVTTLLLVLSAVAVAGAFRGNAERPAIAMALGGTVAGLAAIVSGPDSSIIGSDPEPATFLGIDQNILAFHIALGLAGALFALTRVTGLGFGVSLVSVIGLQVASLIVVGSRTGIGSAVALACVFLVMSLRTARRALGAVIALAVTLLVVRWLSAGGMVPQRVLVWLDNPVATDSRTQIIEAYQLSQSEWILRGIGTGADAYYLQATTGWCANSHSAFWKIWIETGLVGLLLWGMLLAGLAIRAWRSRDRAYFVLAGVPIALFFFTLGPLNSNMLWVVFGLALGSAAVNGSRLPARSATSSAELLGS